MDSDKIRHLLRHVEMFIGVFLADRLPHHRLKKPTLLIVNTDRSDRAGQHWTAIYVDGKGYGELFDSLATEPLKTFRNFMNRNCTRWLKNDLQLQSVISRFCGHYCVMYCLLRAKGFDIQRITSFYSRDTMLNDYMTHAFVCRTE